MMEKVERSFFVKPREALPPAASKVILLVKVDVPPDRKDHGACMTRKKPGAEDPANDSSGGNEGNRVVPHHVLLTIQPFVGEQAVRRIFAVVAFRVRLVDLPDAIVMAENSMQ